MERITRKTSRQARNPLKLFVFKLLLVAFILLFKEKMAWVEPELNSIQWPAGACPEFVEGACPEFVEGACPEFVEGACPEFVEGTLAGNPRQKNSQPLIRIFYKNEIFPTLHLNPIPGIYHPISIGSLHKLPLS